MIQLTASLYNPGSTTDIQNLRHMTKTSQSKSKHKSTSCHAELVCSTACLSCLNSLAHFKRPSIFHGASIMLALLQLSPLSHINSSPTSFKRKKKKLVLSCPSKDPTLIHYSQTSVNIPSLELPPVSFDIRGE